MLITLLLFSLTNSAWAETVVPAPTETPSAGPSVVPIAAPSVAPSAMPSAAPAKKGSEKKQVKIATKSSDLPQLLQEVEEHYGKAKTVSLRFSQVSKTAVTGTVKKSSGNVQFKRPNKFRWEVTQPDPSISVSNGVKAWHYTPPFDEEDSGQVLEQKASKIRTQFLNALLSGSFSSAKGMRITAVKGNSFTLVPKKGTAGTVRKAIIEVDAQSRQIRKVTLDHADGGRAEFTLTEIELGKPIENDVFNFKIPPNTDRAGSEG